MGSGMDLGLNPGMDLGMNLGRAMGRVGGWIERHATDTNSAMGMGDAGSGDPAPDGPPSRGCGRFCG